MTSLPQELRELWDDLYESSSEDSSDEELDEEELKEQLQQIVEENKDLAVSDVIMAWTARE